MSQPPPSRDVYHYDDHNDGHNDHNDHYDTRMLNASRSTVTRSAFDNDECHVTAFRPISEAAHSWSYDNDIVI